MIKRKIVFGPQKVFISRKAEITKRIKIALLVEIFFKVSITDIRKNTIKYQLNANETYYSEVMGGVLGPSVKSTEKGTI